MGKVGSPSPHPGPEGLDQTQDLHPYHTSTGAVRVGRPLLGSGAPGQPSPEAPLSPPGSAPGRLWLWAPGLREWQGGRP